jgi:hypothetical protein
MRYACVAALLAGVAAGAAHAGEPQTPPPAQSKVEPVDAEFLEFLGSLDTEDEAWREYLETRPIRATAGKPAQQKAPPPSQPQPGKQEQVNKS